jgi:hypothetical protein
MEKTGRFENRIMLFFPAKVHQIGTYPTRTGCLHVYNQEGSLGCRMRLFVLKKFKISALAILFLFK